MHLQVDYVKKNRTFAALLYIILYMSKFIKLLLVALFCCQSAYSQDDTLGVPTMTSPRLITLDDYKPEPLYSDYQPVSLNVKPRKTIFTRQGSKFILPTLFIAYGTAARFNQLPVRQFDFDIDHEIRKRKSMAKNYPIDNYFEIATPVLAFGLDFFDGIESRHNFRDRTLIMATSFLVMEGIVYGLKMSFPVARPRNWGEGDNNSFPSGHMAVAMTGAHIMYKEYKDVTPWIGVAGYLMATTTGIFRMINYAHWLSDVVMSAGIGLLSAEIGYMMLPVWHSLFGIDDGGRRFAAVPVIGLQSLGAGLVYQF